MKLFSKKRLKIKETGSTIIYSWRSINIFEIFLVTMIPVALIWGVASYFGYKEVISIKVLKMTPQATIIYWSIVAITTFHIVFNRSVTLSITKKTLKYKKRFILGISRIAKRSDISKIDIKKQRDIAESDGDGADLSSFNLRIYLHSKRRIVIRGLSEPDCKTIWNSLGHRKK